jgi:hypothetical protein
MIYKIVTKNIICLSNPVSSVGYSYKQSFVLTLLLPYRGIINAYLFKFCIELAATSDKTVNLKYL